MYDLEDTIAAIATAPGAAGIAVVRISGAGALAAADAIFRGPIALTAAASHTLHHGWVVWPESANGAASTVSPGGSHRGGPTRRLDEVVAGLFRAPRSYTREDVVEISCHGGRLPADRVLEAALAAGARLAQPGEFTLRAFLNGRMDLTQAEAVADLIHAETERAREIALSQLAGELSQRLGAITERIADALCEIEARVDFAEDVGGVEVPPHVIEAVLAARRELDTLLEGAAFTRAVREGVRLPIVGRPNVGKSSLFNALVGEERAIVAATPGTTRDRVSEAIELDGVRVTLSDTAGLREADGAVESLGIARTQAVLAESPLVLWVVDGSTRLDDQDRSVARAVAGKRVVVAINKRDLPPALDRRELDGLIGGAERRVVEISAARGEGIAELESALAGMLGAGTSAAASAVSNPRHHEALDRARAAMERAAAAGASGAPGEIVALELREGLGAIGEATGKSVTEDLLERIFSRFCVGK